MPSDLTSGRPRRQHRSVPVLVLLIGLLLTASTAERIRRSDDDARRAALEADAAQLGLIVQSLASSIEIDLTSSVGIALVTDGDPDVYRERTGDGSGDRALLSLTPELEIVTVSATDPDEAEAMTRSIQDTVARPEIQTALVALAESGSFGFVPLGDDEHIGSLLIAAGASDDEHSYVEVRQFDLGPAGPMIASLIDGIDTFSVYIGEQADAATAVIASTTDLPLSGRVATAVVEVSDQSLLIEVQGSAGEVIPPWTVFVVGGLMSLALSSLLFVSQRRRDGEIEALTAARTATEARARLEADLQQTQRMEAVGQLAGGIAHDFNNLLAAITSTVELVADDVSDPRTQEDLDEIRHAARRGATLTRRLLSFSRRDVEAREALDLNLVIREMAPLLRRSISEDIHLEIELSDGSVPIRGDVGELEQILLNLVVNARDAATGPSHRISVSTELVDGDRAMLRVVDTGAGMQPAVAARAFEPFFSTKSKSDGTGLGLAIVYGIVQRMDGEASIDSTVGLGTDVSVSLPLDRSVPIAASPSDNDAVDVPTLDRKLILLVEDEPTVRRSTKRLLERAGHRVVDAADGIQAVAAIEDGLDPDLVLTDVVLTGPLNGRDVADQVRKLVPAAEIVFVSGYPSEIISRRELIDDGATFLPKPFDSHALLAAVGADR